MKRGYSMLLGEFLEAGGLVYDDCKAFQIVCAACHEPVFKVVRTIPAEIHYLSHYEQAKAYAADCEMRVERLQNAACEQHNGQSRGQRLRYFLKVLRSMVSETQEQLAKELNPGLGNYLGFWKEMMTKAENNQVFRTLAHLTWEGVRSQELESSQGSDYGISDYILFKEDAFGGEIATSFSVEVQKRIAKDILLYLLTPAGKPNFEWLWFYSCALNSFKWVVIASGEPVSGLSVRLAAALKVPAVDSAEMIREMSHETLPTLFEPRLSDRTDQLFWEGFD